MPKSQLSLNRWTVFWGVTALWVMALLLVPSPLLAQGYELRVTLHDTAGLPIASGTIIVRSEDGQELARSSTDAAGGATFAGLPAVVRVAVEGQLRGGPALFQLGDDAQGVRLALDLAAAPATLDLRAERDGLVLPDPATMLSLEEGGPLVEAAEPFPTAALATPAPLPTSMSGGASGGVVVVGPGEEGERPSAGWAPLLSVLIVAIAAGVMLLLQHRRSTR